MHKRHLSCSLVVFTALLILGFSRVPAENEIWHGCALAPDAQAVWVVTIETTEVFHSPDFGRTWQEQPVLTNFDFFDVYFLDELRGWTCGRLAEVWQTSDGGATWNWQGYGASKFFTRIFFVDSVHGWAAGGAAIMGRWSETEQTWIQVITPLSADTVDYYGVSFVDTLYGWMCAGRYPEHDTFIGGQGFIVRTRDGGSNWVPLARDTLYDYFDIDFVDSLTGWVVGGDDRTMTGYVAHTTDGGKTWIGQGLPEAGMLRALDFVDARHGWAVGMFGTVLRSSDGGATWQDQASGVDSTLFDVDFADTLHGVASGTGSVIVTSDGGQTWTKSVVGGVEEASSVVTRPARLELLLSGSVAKGKVCFHCRSAGCNGSLGDALRLMVYDAKGCMVKTLTIDGTGSALWDGRDWAGRPAPSGAYFARLDKGDRLLAVRFLYLAD